VNYQNLQDDHTSAFLLTLLAFVILLKAASSEALVFVHSLLSFTSILFKMHFTTSVASFAVLALASATALSQRQSTLSGQATYYGGNVAGGTCSFSTYTLPASIYGTALSDSNWDDAENCGACVRVTGPDGNSITAMVSPLTCRHDSYLTVY